MVSEETFRVSTARRSVVSFNGVGVAEARIQCYNPPAMTHLEDLSEAAGGRLRGTSRVPGGAGW
jgi:hypothetical protein